MPLTRGLKAAGLILAVLILQGLCLTAAQAQPPPADIERAAAQLVTPGIQAAIDRGLAYLVRRHQSDGSFGSSGYARNVAVVSLAGMAWLASGSVPGRGPYGEEVARCARFVLDSADESGFLCRMQYASHGPMYDHGFGLLFLAEVYGTWSEDRLRPTLERAVRLTVATQNAEGGWRYQPRPVEADLSVTVCQVMALRAARNAGLYVPPATIDRSVDYITRCQNADGGFMYMLSGGPSRFPRSAAAVVALYGAGQYDSEVLRKGLAYVRQHPPSAEELGRDAYAMYGHYYAAQALWQAGGQGWLEWYPAIAELLLKHQREDGAWNDLICPEYGTAMALLILQMPNNTLPIFQR